MSPSLPVAFFDRISGIYDTGFVQSILYLPTQDAVLAELRALRPCKVLDIGCGTGQLTTRLQTELGASQVFGCDAGPECWDQARTRSPEITWLQGTAESIPLPDGSLDALVSTEAFHWFNQAAALEEFHRVLVPGGRIVIALLTPERVSRVDSSIATRSCLVRHTGRTAAPWPDWSVAGFQVLRQQRVRRGFGYVLPTVVTVATRAG